MLFDFSSVFSVVVCHLLTSYLKWLSASWITDWLTQRAVCEGWSEGNYMTTNALKGQHFLHFGFLCTRHTVKVSVCAYIVCVCSYMSTCVCVSIYIHLCMYVCICVHVCVCTCVHLCMCAGRGEGRWWWLQWLWRWFWGEHHTPSLLWSSLCLLLCSAGHFFLSGHPHISVCCSVLLVTSFSQDTLISLPAALSCWSLLSLRTPSCLCLLLCPAGHFFLSGHPDISVCCSVLLVASFSQDTLMSLSAALSCWSVLSLRTPSCLCLLLCPAGHFFLSGHPDISVCCSVLLVTSFSQHPGVSAALFCSSVFSLRTPSCLCLLLCPAGQFFLSGHPHVSVCCSVLLVTSFSQDTLISLSAALSCWSLLSLNTLESLLLCPAGHFFLSGHPYPVFPLVSEHVSKVR